MTRAELEARATLLASLEGWTDVSPSPNWTTLVNEAWRLFSTDSEILPAVQTVVSVSGQSEYFLSTPFVRITDVTFNSVPLARSTESFERFLGVDWRTKTGTPSRYVVTAASRVALVPVPNSAQNIGVRGYRQGADMALSTDQPGQVSSSGDPIPSSLHEAIALKAAWLQGKAFMQNQSSERMQLFEAEYQSYVKRAAAMRQYRAD